MIKKEEAGEAERPITEVELKNGKRMKHFKDNSGRHVFFNNLVAINYWMSGLLIFILLTSILIGFYTVLYIQEAGNRILMKLENIEAGLGLKNVTLLGSGSYTLYDSCTYDDSCT